MDLGDLTPRASGCPVGCASSRTPSSARTGYRRALEPLVGHLGVLDRSGVPRVRGERAAARGLRFVGYVPRPGGLGYVSKEAIRAARAIARELRAAAATV